MALRKKFHATLKYNPLTPTVANFYPLTLDTSELYRLYRRELDELKFFHSCMPAKQADQHKWYLENYETDLSQYFYSIAINGATMAFASVYNINSGTAEVGRFLSTPAIKGRGIFTLCLAALMEYFTYIHEIQYFYLEVLKSNKSAIKVYERIGFAPDTDLDSNSIRMSCSEINPSVSSLISSRWKPDVHCH